MKRKYYALFSCNEWKERASMDLIGVFTENKIRQIIRKKIKKNDFEYGADIKEIQTGDIDHIDTLLKYGFIQELNINEEL